MGPGNRGRGVAFVLSGLTIANVIGVPLITLLGQTAGWRVAYLAVAGDLRGDPRRDPDRSCRRSRATRPRRSGAS